MEREVSCNAKGITVAVREAQGSLWWWYLLVATPSLACASIQAWLAPGMAWAGIQELPIPDIRAGFCHDTRPGAPERPCSGSSSTFWIPAVTEEALKSS